MSFFPIIFYSCSSLFYHDNINTHFFPVGFVASLVPGTRSSGSIDHKYLSEKRTRIQMNGR